jgi:hypothetical protein
MEINVAIYFHHFLILEICLYFITNFYSLMCINFFMLILIYNLYLFYFEIRKFKNNVFFKSHSKLKYKYFHFGMYFTKFIYIVSYIVLCDEFKNS